MNREVSIRQITFMYLFLSLSPILRQIPSALANESGRSGYLSPLWSIVFVLPLTAVIVLLLKGFPGLNYYEIMVQLVGVVLAKFLIFSYLLWMVLSAVAKINAYTLTMQFTLMPHTRADFFMIILLILVFFALSIGMKTIFRFSELTLGPIIFLFFILFICAVPRLRTDYLLPVSTIKLPSTIKASKNVSAIGGYLIVSLFFADKFGITVSKEQMRRFWYIAYYFTAITFIITIFTYGITGADMAADLPFPFYITVKSISFFNIFERFEVLITLICVLSDFVSFCVFFIIIKQCIKWLFNLETVSFLFVPIAGIIYYLTYFISNTQFEYNYLYKNIVINSNLIFQFFIPIFLGIIGLVKWKRIKKQY